MLNDLASGWCECACAWSDWRNPRRPGRRWCRCRGVRRNGWARVFVRLLDSEKAMPQQVLAQGQSTERVRSCAVRLSDSEKAWPQGVQAKGRSPVRLRYRHVAGAPEGIANEGEFKDTLPPLQTAARQPPLAPLQTLSGKWSTASKPPFSAPARCGSARLTGFFLGIPSDAWRPLKSSASPG